MEDKKQFVSEMERRYGTEEALGVIFELEDERATRISLAEMNALYERLGVNAPGAISLLPHGGSACCCTDYAVHIYLTLEADVKIFGFANKDNPTSRVAREEIHPGGHDFAVVNDRYIVDPWPRFVPGVFEQMVFDMYDEEEAALVEDIYGPSECWKRMHDTERYANELMPQAT